MTRIGLRAHDEQYNLHRDGVIPSQLHGII